LTDSDFWVIFPIRKGVLMSSERMKYMLKVQDIARRLFGGQQTFKKTNFTPEELKGARNEARAFKLIDEILKETGLFALVSRPYISSTYSTEDLDGYDIVIPTERGKIGIQIKSSPKAARVFQRAKPHIPVVVVNWYKSDFQLKTELTIALHSAYDGLTKGRVKIK
jgi:hypothetical protein